MQNKQIPFVVAHYTLMLLYTTHFCFVTNRNPAVGLSTSGVLEVEKVNKTCNSVCRYLQNKRSPDRCHHETVRQVERTITGLVNSEAGRKNNNRLSKQ